MRPFIVVGLAGDDFVIPVKHRAHGAELPAHGGDILHSGVARMNSGLNGKVFGRQTKGIKAHRLKDLEALHAFDSGIRVGQAKIPPVPDMQIRSRGV